MSQDRNFGCRIRSDLIYKGYDAVIMENECFRIMMLPGKGSDVVELLHKPTDTDFVWYTRMGLRKREAAFMDFQQQYEGGWQEILPNLSGKHQYNGITMEAYGEVSLTSWDYVILEDAQDSIQVRFTNRLRTMPLRVEKTVRMVSGEPGFSFVETVHNESPAELHLDWGHHITFGTPFLAPRTVIELPGSHKPYIVPEQGSEGGFDAMVAGEGRYRLMREDGMGAEVLWDHTIWPWLWFWREYGKDHGPPYYGNHFNVGLEVFTSSPA
jgi:hypothetical protein